MATREPLREASMSEYTVEQLLEFIEAETRRGQPLLMLVGKDLKNIDLSIDSIHRVMQKRGLTKADSPPWYSQRTGGVNLARFHLTGSHLEGADLRRADLQQAILAETYLWATNLEEAILVGADLREAEQLWDTNLKAAHLEYARLERIDMSQALLDGAYFCNARLDKTYMKSEQIAAGIGEERDRDYAGAHKAYVELKNNFKSTGYYGHASWAYIKERHMERQTYRSKESRARYLEERLNVLPTGSWRCRHQTVYRTWLHLRLWRFWLLNFAQDWLCGYGERPWNVLWWAAGMVFLFFPLLYWAFGAIYEADSFADYLVYSLLSFAKVTSVELHPTSLSGDFLRGAEVTAGLFLLALFVYSLGRRMSGT